jgi:hypothetical protein
MMLAKRFARSLGGVCAAALLLAVPVFAVRALTPGTADAATAIAPADDVVANGLQIVDTVAPPKPAPGTPASADPAAPAETVLRNWTYTGKPNPSPGH